MTSVARGSTFTCASVFSARVTIACVSSRRAFGSAIRMRSISCVSTDLLEIVRVAEHPHAAHRAPANVGIVVDEADDLRVAVRAAGEFACQRHARVPGADDQRSQTVVGLRRALTFECEQARLEPNATAPEQHDQCGDRRRRENRERAHRSTLSSAMSSSVASDRARRDREHDPCGLFDRCVAPHRTVEAGELIARRAA